MLLFYIIGAIITSVFGIIMAVAKILKYKKKKKDFEITIEDLFASIIAIMGSWVSILFIIYGKTSKDSHTLETPLFRLKFKNENSSTSKNR